jgi:putative FmdB family regulatory protein
VAQFRAGPEETGECISVRNAGFSEMPIYEYRCDDCGSQKEHLQKMSDAAIEKCPSCGSTKYRKLLSAAGFQLKGSGWYATDFKNNQCPAADSSSSGGHTCGGNCGCA